MEKNWVKLKVLLDETYEWPAAYSYKFIVAAEKVDEIKKLFQDYEFTQRASSKGKYVSVTLTKTMNSSDEVIEGYQKVGSVKGVISL
jgi:putative lipoic acid-binding regulatory protein